MRRVAIVVGTRADANQINRSLARVCVYYDESERLKEEAQLLFQAFLDFLFAVALDRGGVAVDRTSGGETDITPLATCRQRRGMWR